ncbi:MAG: hypothetical protein ACI9IA_000725 [Enterobacterales bacterium]|jgi:hypothetical protein
MPPISHEETQEFANNVIHFISAHAQTIFSLLTLSVFIMGFFLGYGYLAKYDGNIIAYASLTDFYKYGITGSKVVFLIIFGVSAFIIFIDRKELFDSAPEYFKLGVLAIPIIFILLLLYIEEPKYQSVMSGEDGRYTITADKSYKCVQVVGTITNFLFVWDYDLHNAQYISLAKISDIRKVLVRAPKPSDYQVGNKPLKQADPKYLKGLEIWKNQLKTVCGQTIK